MFSPIANNNQILVGDDDEFTLTFKFGEGRDNLSPFDDLDDEFEDEDINQVAKDYVTQLMQECQ